jgi:hypothetical protein
MTVFLIVIFFLIGVSLGGYLQKRLTKRAFKIEQEKAAEEKKNKFIELVSKLKNGKSKFKSRINDMAYISVQLDDLGTIDLIYLMDKDDVAIFQDTKCLYTSDGIDKSIINEVINVIYKLYGKKINDVVEILGFVFYREEFEKSFNIKVEDLKKANLFANLENETGEIDKIKTDNSKKFNIDEILDKISAFGIASLTIEERLFLDNYSNEKRD